jgi:hypothetical protein
VFNPVAKTQPWPRFELPTSTAGWSLLFLVMMLVTLAFTVLVERYHAVGPNLLSDSQWLNHNGATVQYLPTGALTIQSNDRSATRGVYQTVPVPPQCELVRLSGTLSSRSIADGPRPWHRGRMILGVETKQRPRRGPLYVAASLSGTEPWESYQLIQACPRGKTHRMNVRLELTRVTGLITARDVRLEVVQQQERFTIIRWLLAGLWLLALCGLTVYLVQAHRGWTLAWLLGIGMLICIGVLLPKALSNQMVDLILGSRSYARTELWSNGLPAHFLLFTALGFAIRRHWSMTGPWIMIGLLVQVAMGAEILQILVLDRDIAVMDAGANVLGVLLGWSAAWALDRLGDNGNKHTSDKGGAP